jgi:hypothetical protein
MMHGPPACLTPERWLIQLFSAQAAASGGVVRRQTRDVDRYVGRDRFVYELRRRGFRAVENAGHFVIFCNSEPVRVVE